MTCARIYLFIAVVAALATNARAAWTDFSNNFDSEAQGQTIGQSNPNWTDVNFGLYVVGAPGGGLALGADETDLNRQSRTTFGDVDPAKVYEFSARVRASHISQDSDAFVNFGNGPITQVGQLSFGMGISDGRLQIVRWSAAADPTVYVLNTPAAADTWYDLRVQYTVKSGATPDIIRGGYKLATDSSWMTLNSTPVQVDLNESSTNHVNARARAIDVVDNYVDNLSGTLTTINPELPRAANFGKRWVRTHPFTVMGAAQGGTPPFSAAQYSGAGLTTVFANAVHAPAEIGAAAGLPWHHHINFPRPITEFTTGMQNTINGFAGTPGGTGWMLPDEPVASEFAALGQMSTWLKQNHPDMITYVTALPKQAVGGSYNDYLDGIVNTIKPDALMFDFYPFAVGGTTDINGWFDNVMSVRAKASAANMPYWAWLQCWDGSPAYRMPSESDMRWNAYSLLASGYTGLNYFIYDTNAETYGMIDSSGNPRAQYTYASNLTPEISRLGNALRMLDSTDVRFLPGSVSTTPTGLTNWAAGAGTDSHILSAGVDLSNSGNQGFEKEGMIGFFKDEFGQPYFMLTNLYHNANLTAAQSNLGFVVQFDNTVTQLLRLNRLTGATELVPLTGNTLNLSLPGGTGDLFKYVGGSFSTTLGPQWMADSAGDWNAPMNWLGTIPNSSGAVANLLTMITTGRTIFTDSPVTVGTLRFNNSATYNIAGAGSLTLATSSGEALIDILSGSHQINVPLSISNNARMIIPTATALTIADPWTLAGGITVHKDGEGTLNVISTVTAGPGATLKINGGTVNMEQSSVGNLTINVDPATLNFGASQSLRQLSIEGGSGVYVGRNRNGGHLPANLSAQTLKATLGGVNILSTTLAGNTATVSGAFEVDAGTTLVKDGPGTLSVAASAVQSHGTGAALTVAAGNALLNSDAGGNLTINAQGGNTNFGATQHLQALNVAAAGRAIVAAGGNRILHAKEITVAGTLDLNEHDIVVDYSGNSPFASLRERIVQGYRSSPDPAARGIISSIGQGDADHRTHKVHAIFDNADAGFFEFPRASGSAIDADTVVAAYAFFGDANLDGQVDADDYEAIDFNLDIIAAGATWLEGDMDWDGAVTGVDYAVVDANLGLGTPDPSAPQLLALRQQMIATHTQTYGQPYVQMLSAAEAGAMVIPEPGALSITLLVGAGYGLRRRRAA
jgi:hypothetical protein